MMKSAALLVWSLAMSLSSAEDAAEDAYYYQGGQAQTDDNTQTSTYMGNDFIKYWTEYAVYPEKCIHYNGKDVIAFAMYEKYYKHCTDSPMGHYYVDVPTFTAAYIDQLSSNAADMGENYEVPEAATYTSCYPYTSSSGSVYYVQIGCADGTSQKLAVNHYKDNLCTTPNKSSSGSDDTSLDISSLSVPFQQCLQCVNYVDKNVDDVDDAYFDQATQNAPLCGTIWQYKKKCRGRCKRLGKVKATWNSSDKVLLCLLAAFSGLMFVLINKKRSKMAKKDMLLEEAVMSSAGLQQSHLIGIISCYVFVTVLAGLSTLKSITWFLLIAMNIILFLYLMKLTIDSGLNVPVGPDGEPLGDDDSSDEEDDDEIVEDAYKSPAYIDENEKKIDDVEDSYKSTIMSGSYNADSGLPPIS